MSGTWRAPKYVPTQNGPFTTDFLLAMHVARTQYAVGTTSTLLVYLQYLFILRYIYTFECIYQARARSAPARRACALRALGLLLADGTPTVGGGKTF